MIYTEYFYDTCTLYNAKGDVFALPVGDYWVLGTCRIPFILHIAFARTLDESKAIAWIADGAVSDVEIFELPLTVGSTQEKGSASFIQ